MAPPARDWSLRRNARSARRLWSHQAGWMLNRCFHAKLEQRGEDDEQYSEGKQKYGHDRTPFQFFFRAAFAGGEPAAASSNRRIVPPGASACNSFIGSLPAPGNEKMASPFFLTPFRRYSPVLTSAFSPSPVRTLLLSHLHTFSLPPAQLDDHPPANYFLPAGQPLRQRGRCIGALGRWIGRQPRPAGRRLLCARPCTRRPLRLVA